MMLPIYSFGQVVLSSEVDVRNALFGSNVNERAYDGTFKAGYRIDGFQAQAVYETFKAIEFQSYGVEAAHVMNEDGDLNYLIIVGMYVVERHVNWLNQVYHPSMGLSGQVEYPTGNFFVSARGEIRHRGDLDRAVMSFYAGIGFKFN